MQFETTNFYAILGYIQIRSISMPSLAPLVVLPVTSSNIFPPAFLKSHADYKWRDLTVTVDSCLTVSVIFNTSFLMVDR